MNKQLREQVLNLPVDEKVDLIMDAWNSIAPGDFPELTDEQKAELDRRLLAYEKNPASSVSWEQLKSDLSARYGK